VGARENKDIFLSEVRSRGQVGTEKQEMDVYLYQFSCAWLGIKHGLKEIFNFSKNPLKLAI
jgi:hypothetical protein